MSIKGKWARLWIDKFSLSTKTQTATINMGVQREEVTAWQDTARTYLTTNTESSIELTGYVDTLADGAGGFEEVLADRLGGGNTVQVGILLAEDATNEAGMPVYVLPATSGERMNISAPAAGILTMDGTFGDGDAGMRRGVLVYQGTFSATGNQTAVDIGAAGAAGGDVWVWVTAITGTATNASVKVQSATTSGGTYADEATVTFSATGGYAAAMTGTVNRWLRLNVAGMGGATAITLAVVVGVDGVTQPA